jgi:hypothetical protein
MPLDAGRERLVLLSDVEELPTYLGVMYSGGLVASTFCLSPISLGALQPLWHFPRLRMAVNNGGAVRFRARPNEAGIKFVCTGAEAIAKGII